MAFIENFNGFKRPTLCPSDKGDAELKACMERNKHKLPHIGLPPRRTQPPTKRPEIKGTIKRPTWPLGSGRWVQFNNTWIWQVWTGTNWILTVHTNSNPPTSNLPRLNPPNLGTGQWMKLKNIWSWHVWTGTIWIPTDLPNLYPLKSNPPTSNPLKPGTGQWIEFNNTWMWQVWTGLNWILTDYKNNDPPTLNPPTLNPPTLNPPTLNPSPKTVYNFNKDGLFGGSNNYSIYIILGCIILIFFLSGLLYLRKN